MIRARKAILEHSFVIIIIIIIIINFIFIFGHQTEHIFYSRAVLLGFCNVSRLVESPRIFGFLLE